MLNYAREDTHYLLYAYDRLRQDLYEKALSNNIENPLALMKKVLVNSSGLCLKVYEKPTTKDMSYYMIIGRNKLH
jgi:exosome complex exonuclease RRP6